MRAIRFASHLAPSFHIDHGLLQAGASQPIANALGSKVSRERLGKEMELIACSRDATRGLGLIESLGLGKVLWPSSAKRWSPAARDLALERY